MVERPTSRTFTYGGFSWRVSVNGGMHFDRDGKSHFLPLPPAELPSTVQLHTMPEDQLCWLLHMASLGKDPNQ